MRITELHLVFLVFKWWGKRQFLVAQSSHTLHAAYDGTTIQTHERKCFLWISESGGMLIKSL